MEPSPLGPGKYRVALRRGSWMALNGAESVRTQKGLRTAGCIPVGSFDGDESVRTRKRGAGESRFELPQRFNGAESVRTRK